MKCKHCGQAIYKGALDLGGIWYHINFMSVYCRITRAEPEDDEEKKED